ncbi:hypothetical protein FH608_017675 [Nonomuraea phyllanthi]|uniref:Uncharacterized protein n=1 Tax=Nonomuraea phyllanthi TaxID=2219224 RepID=A0A5C4WJJ5_9ACTN|nr:hypothetical protein [Nonomuraea phyllanthi]KAB8194023.1 hypothetical protein FH608_017675 [Nonomuraea phyllanthi]QFY07623.1 hypothetical protein GBF35_13840 [Nonomuraea phyllanthi]
MSVTAARMRDLVSRAEALTAEVREVCGGAPSGSAEHEHIRAARHAADWLARGVEDLERAAAELERLEALRDQVCGIGWGVCPEHGNTLRSSAGVATCRVCERSWSYDRLGQPCRERVAWKVVDPGGTETRMCGGHVLGARAAMAGASFTQL